ncbi:MAG: hypothetical protein KF722_17225 [Nitrospira sp.]|nr:hypothetical protein [Nitrospira sp.]
MKKIVVIALLIPYFLVVMSILIVLFAGLTVKHISTDVMPYITNPVTSIAGVEA